MSQYDNAPEKLEIELATLRQRVQDLESRLAEISHPQNEILANMSRAGQFARASDGKILFTNAKFDTLFGYEAGELIGKHHSVLIAPLYPDERLSVNKNNPNIPQGDQKTVRKDGTFFWSHVIVSTFHHSEFGDVWISVYEDITARKHMEATLRASEERYRQMIEYQMDLICHYNANFEIVFVNDAYCRTFGRTYDELIGKSILPNIPSDYVSHARDHVAQLTLDRLFASSEHPSIMPDGTVRWFQWQDQAILNKQGEIIEYQAVGRDITERKEAEDALMEEHIVLQTLIDAIPDYIFVKDRDGRFIVSNKAHTEASSVSSTDELIGKTAKDIFPAELADQFHHDDDEVMSLNQARISMERLTVDSDGNDKWVSTTKVPLLDENAEVKGLVGISRDITERKLAKLAFQDSETRYGRLIQEAPVCIHEIGLDKNFISMNPTGLTMLNAVTEAEIIGTPSLDVVAIKDRERINAFMDEAFFGNDVFMEFETAGDLPRIFSSNFIPIKDQDGSVQKLMGITQDVTERRQAEKALRESEAKYRDLVETSQGLIWSADLEARFTYLNPAWQETLGYQLDEMLGHSSVEFMPPSEIENNTKVLISLLDGNVIRGYEISFNAKSGALVYLVVNAKPQYDIDGNIIGTQGTAYDITQRKNSETLALDHERLRTQFQKEQEQINVIQRIISTLSHDMRTPLTVISLARDMLEKYYDKLSVEKRQEKLDTIDHQLQFALQLLNDTVQVARGTHIFKPSMVNLATLCEISIDEKSMEETDHHNLVFINTGQIETVLIDETLVSRILLNLLSNAVKYSPDGGEIRLELDYYEAGILLRVTDYGIGISEEDLPNIFDLLYRANNVQNILGTGLGLNIVKDCVERHNGVITVESELGKGSTFTVKIPIPPNTDATT